MDYKGQLLTVWIKDVQGVQRPEVTATHRLKNVAQNVVESGKDVRVGNICTCDFRATEIQLTGLRADQKIKIVEVYEDNDSNEAEKPVQPVPDKLSDYLLANGVDLASATTASRTKDAQSCIDECKRIARKKARGTVLGSGVTRVKAKKT